MSALRRLRHLSGRAYFGVKKLLPPWKWLDRLLLLPAFVRLNSRLPLSLDSPKAGYTDLSFAITTSREWTELDRRATDKVTAPEVARALSPTVKFPRREAVIDVPSGTTSMQIKEFLEPFRGRNLIAKPAHSCGGMVYLHQPPSDEEWDALFLRATTDYYAFARERQYRGMPRRIVVEEVLGGPARGIVDYKLVCVFGRPVMASFGIGVGDQRRRGFYTLPDWCGLPFDQPIVISRSYVHDRFDLTEPRPERLDEMMRIAAELSAPFDVVRIDLYSQPDGVYFSEFTLTAGGGVMPLTPNLGNDRAILAAYRAAQSGARK
jgi:hypothetical protein